MRRFGRLHWTLVGKRNKRRRPNIATLAIPIEPAMAPALAPSTHLNYLDGIRGIVALFVVLHHAIAEYTWIGLQHYPAAWVATLKVLQNGRVPVEIFLALSGYCLMLPVATRGRLRGGLLGFFRRRGIRILPPYYAALIFCALLGRYLPYFQRPTGEPRWFQVAIPFDWKAIWTHLLLIHPVFPGLEYRIDYPMWSIGIEWWIYFVFALLFLPLWRWGGAVLPLFAAIAFSFYGTRIWQFNREWHVGFLGLFAAGMLAACVGTSRAWGDRWLQWIPRRLWGWLTLLAAACLSYAWQSDVDSWGDTDELVVATGFFTVVLLAWLYRRTVLEGRPSRVRIFLEWRPVHALGRISYSLYLIHALVLTLVHAAVIEAGWPRPQQLLIGVIMGVPLAVAVGWAFWWCCERWTLERPTSSSLPALTPVPETVAH